MACQAAERAGYAPLKMHNGILQLVKVSDYGEQAVKDFNAGRISVLKPLRKRKRRT